MTQVEQKQASVFITRRCYARQYYFTRVTPEQSDVIYALICELRQDHALNSQVVREGLIANLRDPNIYYQMAWSGTGGYVTNTQPWCW